MLTIVSDVHGKYSEFVKIARQHQFVVQLGDFGFCYKCLRDNNLDHVFIVGGNHENQPELEKIPNYLGNFGERELNGVKFFFIRGAYSIDKFYRKIGIDWFPNEELNFTEANECISEYNRVRPDIVLSHDCPNFVIRDCMKKDYVFSQTQRLLGGLWRVHQPKLWVFAHWHASMTFQVARTKFVCLNELETLEIGNE